MEGVVEGLKLVYGPGSSAFCRYLHYNTVRRRRVEDSSLNSKLVRFLANCTALS